MFRPPDVPPGLRNRVESDEFVRMLRDFALADSTPEGDTRKARPLQSMTLEGIEISITPRSP